MLSSPSDLPTRRASRFHRSSFLLSKDLDSDDPEVAGLSMVGIAGFEPATSALSGLRSYRAELYALTVFPEGAPVQAPTWLVRGPSSRIARPRPSCDLQATFLLLCRRPPSSVKSGREQEAPTPLHHLFGLQRRHPPMVGPVGLEPTTIRLRVGCSSN